MGLHIIHHFHHQQLSHHCIGYLKCNWRNDFIQMRNTTNLSKTIIFFDEAVNFENFCFDSNWVEKFKIQGNLKQLCSENCYFGSITWKKLPVSIKVGAKDVIIFIIIVIFYWVYIWIRQWKRVDWAFCCSKRYLKDLFKSADSH